MVMRCGSIRQRHPRLCGAVLRFLTDTAHWHRPPEGGARERQCRNCRTTLTISHLIHCPTVQRRRADAAAAVSSHISVSETAASI